MKYLLLITQGEWYANGSADERDRAMGLFEEWWREQYRSGKMVDGGQLQSPDTATTVVIERDRSMLIDRPLMEAKEAIGGFGILDVADLEEALTIVRTMPVPDGKVEVRRLVDRDP